VPVAVDWSSLSESELSVSERVAEQLVRLIADGQLHHGDRIPSERELAALVGVSRTSVREALRHLEMRGMVDRRRGRGTVVVSIERPELGAAMLGSMSASGRVLREVMDLRAVVEPPIAERAAARGTSSQIKALGALVDQAEALQLQAEPSVESFIALDIAFHTALARMTQNEMLERLLALTNEWMGPSRSRTLQTERRVHRSVAAHRQIFDAVRRRDAHQANIMMTLHLDDILSIITSDGHADAAWTAPTTGHDEEHA
jgi:GntR family transcriptional regulator, transcriptional repressor for pyruvate dehydrogenase complex